MRISAKDLGALAMDGFCPRCFWIERHDRDLPFQRGFPGIFLSIDSYTKHIVEAHFALKNKLPSWLGELGEAERIIRVKASAFRVVKGETTFTGVPDLIFQRPDGSFAIVDYKTARYTETQDALAPIYRIQLNGYAYIAEAIGERPVNDLYLVYFEPPARDEFESIAGRRTTDSGFEMPFRPRIKRVKKDTAEVARLLERAERICANSEPPEGAEGCEECARLESLVRLAGGKAQA